MNQVEEAVACLERVMRGEHLMERKVFTYKDVEEARGWIGKEGIFSNTLSEIEHEAGENGILKTVDPYSFHFAWAEGKAWQFFSPDPIPVEKRVPFTAEDWELFAGKFVTCKAWNAKTCGAMVVHFGREYISVSSYAVGGILEGDSIMYQELLNDWTFLDGTPCGKKVVG